MQRSSRVFFLRQKFLLRLIERESKYLRGRERSVFAKTMRTVAIEAKPLRKARNKYQETGQDCWLCRLVAYNGALSECSHAKGLQCYGGPDSTAGTSEPCDLWGLLFETRQVNTSSFCWMQNAHFYPLFFVLIRPRRGKTMGERGFKMAEAKKTDNSRRAERNAFFSLGRRPRASYRVRKFPEKNSKSHKDTI